MSAGIYCRTQGELMTEPFLVAGKVHKSFNGHHAVDDVSFTIVDGLRCRVQRRSSKFACPRWVCTCLTP